MTPEIEQSEKEKFRRKWENQDFGWTNSDFNTAEKVWLSRAEEAHRVMEELKKWIGEQISYNLHLKGDSYANGFHFALKELRDKITELEGK